MSTFRNRLRNVSGRYSLYASTIFVGAFLLFVIQPIAGKHLLPWFGGSSSVWATSLAFFTSMLFSGYVYVFLLTRYGGKRQSLIHLVVLLASMIPAFIALFSWHSLFPSLWWTVGDTADPAFQVLAALFIAIGPSYVLLSTTSPLLQYWYATDTSDELSKLKEPYKLYALSNVASLFALLGYPTIFEPYISLHVQENLWGIAFVVYALLCITICALTVRERHHMKAIHPVPTGVNQSMIGAISWIALAALPAFLLVATTTTITQVVAPVPLLWTVPLSIYLATFIIAFSGYARSKYLPLFLLLATCVAYYYTPSAHSSVVAQLFSYLVLLFFCGLVCHARLYALRPPAERLPLFYLFLSLGGMLGTLAASIVAPLIFQDFWEFTVGLALCALCVGTMLNVEFFPRVLTIEKIMLTRIVFVAVIVTLFVRTVTADPGVEDISSRNFYGNASVRFSRDLIELRHGTTLHGMQFAKKEWAFLPTSYYAPSSGIGRSLLFEESKKKKESIRVGVIGLGAGSIASYCRPDDAYVFYEIDARMESIARKYFSYLANCKGSAVHIGDARMLLQKERDNSQLGMYDLLAVDAFADDTVPVHLLTLQALDLYRAHLRGAQSIIAIHTSNRYLTLAPVLLRLAAQMGMSATVITDGGNSVPGGFPTQWVLLARDAHVFNDPAFANTYMALPKPSNAVWTDDYTSLVPIFNLSLFGL